MENNIDTPKEEVDPLITKTIDAFYTEFLKIGNQRALRSKIIHPFLNHALSIFGPFLSVIASLMTFLIFLMLTIIILLVGWILKSKDIGGPSRSLNEQLLFNSPLMLGSPATV